MTEAEYIQRLETLWPGDSDASLEVITLADAALSAFPGSPRLWCIRGDLIQLAAEECPYSLEEALASYKRAVEIDPQCVEAWEGIGSYHAAVLGDERAAEPCFAEARRLRQQLHEARRLQQREEATTPSTRKCRIRYGILLPGLVQALAGGICVCVFAVMAQRATEGLGYLILSLVHVPAALMIGLLLDCIVSGFHWKSRFRLFGSALVIGLLPFLALWLLLACWSLRWCPRWVGSGVGSGLACS